jgi:putative phosphoesterase
LARIPNAAHRVYAAFEGVDEILHAGDIGDPSIITELEVIAPVHAVYGNVDGWDVRQQVGESVELERHGHRIAMVHGHQWGSPKVKDLVEAYPDFSAVVFGHTHQSLIEKTSGPLVVNPGSAGHQSFGNPVTAAILTLERHLEPSARLIDLLP